MKMALEFKSVIVQIFIHFYDSKYILSHNYYFGVIFHQMLKGVFTGFESFNYG